MSTKSLIPNNTSKSWLQNLERDSTLWYPYFVSDPLKHCTIVAFGSQICLYTAMLF